MVKKSISRKVKRRTAARKAARQPRGRRFPLYYLGIRARLALRKYFLYQLER